MFVSTLFVPPPPTFAIALATAMFVPVAAEIPPVGLLKLDKIE
jgi:hypothetical protein